MSPRFAFWPPFCAENRPYWFRPALRESFQPRRPIRRSLPPQRVEIDAQVSELGKLTAHLHYILARRHGIRPPPGIPRCAANPMETARSNDHDAGRPAGRCRFRAAEQSARHGESIRVANLLHAGEFPGLVGQARRSPCRCSRWDFRTFSPIFQAGGTCRKPAERHHGTYHRISG